MIDGLSNVSGLQYVIVMQGCPLFPAEFRSFAEITQDPLQVGCTIR